MEKIKVIDLLNKIANGEVMPKKIKWNNKIYISKGNAIENFVDYINDDDDYCFEHYIGYSSLNDEVEIIEEDKKIEKLDTYVDRIPIQCDDIEEVKEAINKCLLILETKINEIIEVINERTI